MASGAATSTTGSRSGARSWWIPLAGLATGAAAWELIGQHTPQTRFVSLSSTLRALVDQTASGELPDALLSSGSLYVLGLAASVVVGTAIGLLLGRSRLLGDGLLPYLNALYATPMVALIPFILAAFGFGLWPKVLIVFLFGVFPVALAALEGVRSVPNALLEVARSYRSSERRLWIHVVAPYALSCAMTGVRQAIALCVVGMLAAEFYLDPSGLGELILVNAQRFDTANVLAALLVTTVVGVLVMAAGRWLDRRFSTWKADPQ